MKGGILVLGIGNLLMGDEGIGVHAVRTLAETELPPEVTVVDGGTGGFHLLGWLEAFDRIVLIDAALDDRPPGTVSVTEPRYPADLPRTLTAHDIGLRDLVEAAALVGATPRLRLVTVSVDHLQPMDTALSPAVAAALPEIVATVRSQIEVLRALT